MALEHAQPAQPWDVRPLGASIAGQSSHALFKSRQLEVIRLVLPAGRSLPEHRVAGELTLHCLEGDLVVQAQGATHALGAGQLLFLPGGVPHSVTAQLDSSALLTLVLAPGEGGDRSGPA
ncbi:MAG: cupin domain-containing protein [Burkholderiaceae bacterium]